MFPRFLSAEFFQPGFRHHIMSVQFHPESSPGPIDTDWIFDYFLEKAGVQALRRSHSVLKEQERSGRSEDSYKPERQLKNNEK